MLRSEPLPPDEFGAALDEIRQSIGLSQHNWWEK